MGDCSPIPGTKKALRPTLKAMGAINSLALTEQGYNWGNGHRKMLFWLCGILLSASNVKGQNASATPTPVGQTAQQLSQVIVTAGIPIEETVLPTVSPTDAVLGTDMNVLDTPRNVSVLTSAQIQARQIVDVTNLGQYASGTYTPSIFGASGVPFIRSQYAEIYQNGQRLQFYSNSMPPSLNGVESIDIVKGPGSPVIGISDIGVGGYVNFATKEPFFDRWHSTLTFTLGDWVGGGNSYIYPEWQLDIGGPLISDKLAIRVSYLGREADSYYNNVKNQTEDLFVAIRYMPIPALSFDLTGQFYEARFAENNGINRVTQQLIDNQVYLSGPFTPFPNANVPWQGYVTPLGPNGKYLPSQFIHLNGNNVIVAPGDSAYGKRYLPQLVAKAQVAEDFQIVWRTFFEDTTSRKIDNFGYDEWSPLNDVVETRLELHYDFHLFGGSSTEVVGEGKNAVTQTEDHPGILNSIVAGASFRHEENLNYNDFVIEPFTVYNLAQGANFTLFPHSVIFAGQRVPGSPGYSGSAFSLTYQDASNDFGMFFQDTVSLTKWLTLFGGVRVDYVEAKSRTPALGSFLNGSGGPTPAGPYISHNALDPSFFGSITIKPLSWVTTYFTYDRTTAVEGEPNWGGILPSFTSKYLANHTDLYEAGVKASFLQNTLFAALTGYYQDYTQYDIHDHPLETRTWGLECEATYQPNRNFNASANFTVSRTKYANITPADAIFVQTNDYLDVFAPSFTDANGGRGKGGTNTSTGFSPNYTAVFLNSSNPDVVSVPNLLFNAYLTYQLDCGLGASIGPQVTGQIDENPQKTLKIPAQVTWNGAIFYKQKNWEVQLNFFNFTDNRNWTPVATFASNDSIFPNEPFHMNVTFKFKF
jgi:outer membrane receptor protein involved in Fe transport